MVHCVGSMKRWLVVAFVGIVFGTLGAGLYIGKVRQSSPVPGVQNTQESGDVTLVSWKDPAGFSFDYPEGVTINKHDEDQENYAHVELTRPDDPGRIIVWAKDTTAQDVAAWVKTEKAFQGASVVDTTLGGQPAKKILITSPAKKFVVGTVFDDIVWYAEAQLGEGDFWQKTFDTLSASFRFIPLAGENESAGTGESYDDYSVDEEEVIE